VLTDLASSSVVGSLSPLDILNVGADFIAFVFDAPLSPLGAVSLPIDLIGAQTGLHTDEIVSGWGDLGALPGAAAPTLSGAANAASGTVSAGLAEANIIGGLSVPPTWTAATPAVRAIAVALPPASIGIDQQALSAGLGSTVGDMTMMTAAGRALGDTLGVRGGERARAAVSSRKTAPAEDSAAADDEAAAQSEPRTVVTGIAAEIREFAKLRDEGLITDEQFVEQRNRLLGLPGAGGQSG
jgi:PPE-repeat protein